MNVGLGEITASSSPLLKPVRRPGRDEARNVGKVDGITGGEVDGDDVAGAVVDDVDDEEIVARMCLRRIADVDTRLGVEELERPIVHQIERVDAVEAAGCAAAEVDLIEGVVEQEVAVGGEVHHLGIQHRADGLAVDQRGAQREGMVGAVHGVDDADTVLRVAVFVFQDEGQLFPVTE